MDALPRNPTGKILKRDLRKPYWSDRERQTVWGERPCVAPGDVEPAATGLAYVLAVPTADSPLHHRPYRWLLAGTT